MGCLFINLYLCLADVVLLGHGPLVMKSTCKMFAGSMNRYSKQKGMHSGLEDWILCHILHGPRFLLPLGKAASWVLGWWLTLD